MKKKALTRIMTILQLNLEDIQPRGLLNGEQMSYASSYFFLLGYSQFIDGIGGSILPDDLSLCLSIENHCVDVY